MLSPDFRDFVRSLEDNGVRYLVVGGYAVALHGHPRYTKGLDIWIERDESNADRLMLALETFGFGGIGLSRSDFLLDDEIIQLGQPPQRIDLLTSVPGVDFEACYERRVDVAVDGMMVRFIGLEDLRRAKATSGRYQDLADLENLK